MPFGRSRPIAHPPTEKRSVFCRQYDWLEEWERGETRSDFLEVRSVFGGSAIGFFGGVRSAF